MHYAAFAGSTTLIKVLMSLGAEVSAKSNDGDTPLMMASAHCSLECVKILVEEGKSDVHAQASSGIHPLYAAAEHGREDIAAYLISKGPPVDLQGVDGMTPLSRTVTFKRNGCLELLIQHGADVNVVSAKGMPLLHLAVIGGNLKVIQTLIDKGADVNKQEANHDASPIYVACDNRVQNQKDIVQLLLKYSPNLELVCEREMTALTTSICHGDEELVKMLLEAGASPLNYDTDVSEAINPLCKAIRKGYRAIAQLLIKHGADIDASDADGETPLCVASVKGDVRMIEILFEHGVDIDQGVEDGLSAISSALWDNQLEAAKTLAELGADLNKHGTFSVSPFYLAIEGGDIETIQTFIRLGAKLNKRINEELPLNVAVDAGLQCVEVLIDAGADVNSVDGREESALHVAAKRGLLQIVKALLKVGANANIRGKSGTTPLHVAAEQGRIEICRLLLENGADPFLTTTSSATPCGLAEAKNQAEVVKLLVGILKTGQLPKRGACLPRRAACDEGDDEPAAGSSSKAIPEESFCCPITFSLMEDPVVAADGHSYEREAVSRWIRSHGTSPITKQPLRLDALVPNLNLKNQIEAYKAKNAI